jgi:hypothetical protein
MSTATTFPVWVGPAKMSVSGRGGAFCLGILKISDNRVRLKSEQRAFDLAFSGVEIKWPFHTFGSGCYAIWPNGKCSIFFCKPFEDAPSHSENKVEEISGDISEIAEHAGSIFSFLEMLLAPLKLIGPVIALFFMSRDIKNGMATGKLVKKLLQG